MEKTAPFSRQGLNIDKSQYNLYIVYTVKLSPQWLTPRNVANTLNVSIELVYKLLQKGELPAIRIASSWRISQEALNQWMAIQRMNARYAQLQELEASVLHAYKERLQKLYGPQFVEMYIYGSAARGTATEDSDLDVLVVLKAFDDRRAEHEKARRIAYDVSYGEGKAVLVSTYLVTQQELLSENLPVMIRIREEGKIVI